MKCSIRRRTAALAAVSAFAFSTTAAPALAHYCFKVDWKNTSAANSQAWMTAQDWIEFIPFIAAEEGLPQCAVDGLVGWFEAQPETTLFMGPGLLAGGRLHKGKDQPQQFGHVPFEQVVGEACAQV